MKKSHFWSVCAAVFFFVVIISGCSSNSPSAPSAPVKTLSDPFTWKQLTVTNPFTPADWNDAVVFNNKMWLIGGRKIGGEIIAEVWSSPDGADWTLVTGNAAFGPRFRHQAVAFGNKIWVIGGTPNNGSDETALNDVWSSTNGADWTLVTGNAAFAARYSFGACSYGGKMWVMGGCESDVGYTSLYNDVWSSTDGVTWTQVTSAAAFPERCVFKPVIHNNKMYVIGGGRDSYETYLGMYYTWGDNDVWSSSNGADWEQLTGNAGFSPRTALTAFSADGRLFAGFGYTSNEMDDIWYSDNGKLWSLISRDITGTPRFRARALVFNGRAWIIGGSSCDEGCALAEVWYAD